jgi:hypothetical protein
MFAVSELVSTLNKKKHYCDPLASMVIHQSQYGLYMDYTNGLSDRENQHKFYNWNVSKIKGTSWK